MTTPAQINKSLVKEGIAVTIYRGNGYYYFIGDCPYHNIPSIYANNLKAYTTKEIIELINKSKH